MKLSTYRFISLLQSEYGTPGIFYTQKDRWSFEEGSILVFSSSPAVRMTLYSEGDTFDFVFEGLVLHNLGSTWQYNPSPISERGLLYKELYEIFSERGLSAEDIGDKIYEGFCKHFG